MMVVEEIPTMAWAIPSQKLSECLCKDRENAGKKLLLYSGGSNRKEYHHLIPASSRPQPYMKGPM